MPLHFTVLASGSGGNASLLEFDGFGVLLDAGLGPRKLANRLVAVDASWSRVHAVLLTHTHLDHWKDTTLRHLNRHHIPLYCHGHHQQALTAYGQHFADLHTAGLVKAYEADAKFFIAPGLACRPLALRHDGAPTFGFRFDATDRLGQSFALGYVADLGSWSINLAQQLSDVDLLALEFNHDVNLECDSGRPPFLVTRVLGDEGHLSNIQAVALLQEILRRSTRGRMQHVVQLHLSRECNSPDLAAETARQALVDLAPGIGLHTASQDKPLHTIVLETRSAHPSLQSHLHARALMRSGAFGGVQRCFPIMEE